MRLHKNHFISSHKTQVTYSMHCKISNNTVQVKVPVAFMFVIMDRFSFQAFLPIVQVSTEMFNDRYGESATSRSHYLLQLSINKI